MRIKSTISTVLLAILFLSLFTGCKTEKEELITDKNVEYVMPLVPGKYIAYRLDSLVFTNFNKTVETHRYQVKLQVDAAITDNLGRPAFRVFRFMRDSAGTQSWQPNGTLTVTVLEDQVEVTEDNIRFISLHMPMHDGFTWRGNQYAPNDPYLPFGYNFSNDNSDIFPRWDYYYDGDPGQSFSYNGKNYTNVVTVEQQDEVTNVPIVSPASYASKSRGVEKYSKGIGLVYKKYELWEYQPDPTGGSSFNYFGFGITMWMIDHN